MLNREQEIWETLGIASTTNKREVKRAYAEAVKHCHPEENPEAFQKLYEAYQAALNLCVLRTKTQSTLQQEDTSSRQTLPVETISKSKEDVAPENDTKQEDNESYEKARQLLNQIPHEKNSKVLLEKEQDIESYHQEKKQNPPPSNTKIEEQQNKLDYQEDTQNLQQDSADTKEQRNKLQQGSIQNLPLRDFNIEEKKKYEALFSQNSQRQQEVLLYWESLWKEYLANSSLQNSMGLLQFMYNRDFLLIRDLDSIPNTIAAFLTKNIEKTSKDFVYALWDVFDYQHYDTVAGQVLYVPGYQKLYWILKKEFDRYVEMSIFDRHGKLVKSAKRIFYIGIFALIVIVSFGLTIQSNEINRNRYPNRRAACEQVRNLMKEKYPDFIFSGGMNPPDNTEREYVIEGKVRPKGELLSNEQNIRITIVDDGEGNMVSYSDNFENRSIQMLANKYGLHCSISLKKASGEQFLSVELTTADTIEAQETELENIYAVLQKDTIQNLAPSTITFHVKDATNNSKEKTLQYPFSDLPSQEILLKEIWEESIKELGS